MEADLMADDVTQVEKAIRWAWLAVSVIWAATFLASGAAARHGIQGGDCCIAAAPFVLSIVVRRFWGSV